MSDRSKNQPVLGLALGGGAAKGWAHIGVLQELERMGLRPHVVCGTSIGALVGAVYASDQLEAFSDWVQSLTVRDVFGLMDFSFSGGVIKGEKLFEFFQERHQNPDIQELAVQYAAVATDMRNGRETWLDRGPVLQAARASCALPGLFSPVQHEGHWMLDGGLVNPVPVSVCRAMGADVVLAVNLNHLPAGRPIARPNRQGMAEDKAGEQDDSFWRKVMSFLGSEEGEDPGFFDVMTASVNIMQDRITRSRMAGDPAEEMLAPELGDFAIMDFHRAGEAIEEGQRLTRESEGRLRAWLGGADEAEDSW
jgi:NTE family protein